jgi:hypothetical protein
MVQLCEDASPRIRSNAVFALTPELDRADVRALFVRMTTDQSAQVRVTAMGGLDPVKYESELREIAGGDVEAAEGAASYLYQIKKKPE